MDSHEASVPPPSTEVQQTLGQKLVRTAALLFGVGLFAYTLRDLQITDLGRLLAEIGPACVLVAVPQAVGILFHTAAWKELLAALKSRAPYFALVGLYVEAEAVRMALPAGPAISESFSAWQLKSRFEVAWTRSLASMAAKKAWVLCSHAACFVLLLLVGHEAFARLAANTPGGFALGWVAAGTAACLLLAGTLTIVLLASRRAGRVVTSILSRAPWKKLRAWAEEQQSRPEAVAAASIPAKSHAAAGLLMLGQWLTEIAETWLILHLVGIPVTFTEAFVVELGGSLVRSLAFVVPGGLGVQDASYVSLLSGLGVASPESGAVAAFVLLKRAKDIFYVALGLGLFALGNRTRSRVFRDQKKPISAPTLVENQL
ncbi:MAG: flippase-like domain-containing protein [Polyangiaceae bacterium]|nr:flippase-like domain-containing protein [Polyangiaceae bacterium]